MPIILSPAWQGTFGVVLDYEHRGGYRWFLRVRAQQSRGPSWGAAGRPGVQNPILTLKYVGLINVVFAVCHY